MELIKGKTKSGIEFTINPAIKDDSRLLYLLTKLQDETLQPMEQSKYMFSMLELIFGGGDGLANFMNAVAAAHDGVADTKNLMAEMNEMFEVLSLKNS